MSTYQIEQPLVAQLQEGDYQVIEFTQPVVAQLGSFIIQTNTSVKKHYVLE